MKQIMKNVKLNPQNMFVKKNYLQTPWNQIPKFKKGCLLSIILTLNTNIEQNIIGSFMKIKYQGFDTKIVLKHIVNTETIIQEIPLYSPFIKKIQIIE